MVSLRFVSQSLLMVALVPPACDRPESRRSGSAGAPVTQIVELHRETPDSSRGIADTPTISIGVERGTATYELHQVRGARRLADGRVVVANGGSAELRVYDQNGRFLQAIGGPGEGPGEFSYLGGVEVAQGDTLVALDIGLRRFTAFTPDGTHQWTRSLKGVDGIWLAEVWPDDFLIGRGIVSLWAIPDPAMIDRTPPGTRYRERVAVLLHDLDGAFLDTIAVVAGQEYAVIQGSDGDKSVTAAIMGRHVSYSLSTDAVFLGTQERYEISEYQLDGHVSRRLIDTSVDLVATRADLARFTAPMIEQAGTDPTVQQRVREYIALQGRPDERPAFGRIIVSDAGDLWISEAVGHLATPQEWRVVDVKSGEYHLVTVPARFDIYQVGGNFVLGRWRDEYGVEFVRVYRLSR